MSTATTALGQALANEQELLAEWVQLQLGASTLRSDLLNERELRRQSLEFLGLFRSAVATAAPFSMTAPEWEEPRAFLAAVSRSRALQGFSPIETATFVMSLKQPVF